MQLDAPQPVEGGYPFLKGKEKVGQGGWRKLWEERREGKKTMNMPTLTKQLIN